MIFTEEFIEVLKTQALEFVKTSTPARSLKQAMTSFYRKLPRGHQIIVHIPHYWARYYHDGSGPITLSKGHYMVWFKDPKDDPRIRGGYPVNRSDIQRLTLSKEEFTRLIKEEKIYVRQSVGRRKGKFFTRNAYRLWGPWVREELKQAVFYELRQILAPLKQVKEI
jgi:hypothetical protein